MRNREYDREYGKKWHAENRDEENRKSREWQRQNREKRAAYMRDWNAKQRSVDPVNHSKKIRQTTLKRKYGITHEQYEEMLQRQGGHCALCERTPDKERHGKLNVDHCHETGRIRGLLCTVHNSALAAFGDNEEGLIRAIAYVSGGA